MNVIFKQQDGDVVRVLIEQGITEDADHMLFGRLVTTGKLWDNQPDGSFTMREHHAHSREVALVWDEQRCLVEVGGVDGLTGAEVALLIEAGFTVTDDFIPQAVL